VYMLRDGFKERTNFVVQFAFVVHFAYSSAPPTSPPSANMCGRKWV
jgi:hypothetical protein